MSSLSESDAKESSSVQKLIGEHRAGIERELGCRFVFTDTPNMQKPVWLIGPRACNPEIQRMQRPEAIGPELYLDRKKGLLISDGCNPNEVTETYSYLRSLHLFEGGLWQIRECINIDEAISRIVTEVGNSFPAFKLKNLNWDEICARHVPLVKSAADPVVAMQRWLAELQDAHTWVRPFPPYAELPYELKVQSGVGRFYSVPENSEAYKAGVRVGDELLGQDFQGWWKRTAASSHSKPWVVGKRVLSSKRGIKRALQVKTGDGQIIEWEEEPLTDRWSPPFSSRKLKSGYGYIRVKAWLADKGIEESVDEAFTQFRDCPAIIVDLRSNPGGNLLLSHRFRNRFVRSAGPVGWIQNTLSDGSLSEKESIIAEMAPEKQQWTKPVIFLTDQLTYSASEDVLLGLQGQPHVRVVGASSGGGSGRMRLLRLLDGWRLTVSTALTFDLKGHCIEGNGILVDVLCDPSSIDLEALVW